MRKTIGSKVDTLSLRECLESPHSVPGTLSSLAPRSWLRLERQRQLHKKATFREWLDSKGGSTRWGGHSVESLDSHWDGLAKRQKLLGKSRYRRANVSEYAFRRWAFGVEAWSR